MRQRNTIRSIIGLFLTVLVLTAGCSNLPTQPSAPALNDTSASGGGSASGGAPSEVLGLFGTSSSTTTTRTVGVLGGVVAAGNFNVVIPPGALLQTATITVSQPDPAHPVVNLSISPASANKFLLPVLLVAKASPMDRTLLSVAYISYYNPSTGRWERVANCSVNLLDLTVTAPLWHFSTYRVESGGKAGW